MCLLKLSVAICTAQCAGIHQLQRDLDRHALVEGDEVPFLLDELEDIWHMRQVSHAGSFGELVPAKVPPGSR